MPKLFARPINTKPDIWNKDLLNAEPTAAQREYWEQQYQVKKQERAKWEEDFITTEKRTEIEALAKSYKDEDFTECYLDALYAAHKARQKFTYGVVAATTPFWHSTLFTWLTDSEDGILHDLERDYTFTVPLALPDEGAVNIKFHTKRFGDSPSQLNVRLADKAELVGHLGDVFFRGSIEQTFAGDMTTYLVFVTGKNQQIADTIAAVLFKFLDGHHPKEFAGYLAPSLKCMTCSRPLLDEISKAVGLGATCAKKLGVPHSFAAAETTLQARAQHAQWLQSLTHQGNK